MRSGPRLLSVLAFLVSAAILPACGEDPPATAAAPTPKDVAGVHKLEAVYWDMLRDVKNGVQAPWLSNDPAWATAIAQRDGLEDEVPSEFVAELGLDAGWSDLATAREKVVEARELFDQAKKTPSPRQGELVRAGNELLKAAKALVGRATEVWKAARAASAALEARRRNTNPVEDAARGAERAARRLFGVVVEVGNTLYDGWQVASGSYRSEDGRWNPNAEYHPVSGIGKVIQTGQLPPVPPNPGIPAKLGEWWMKATSADPAQRQEAGEDLGDAAFEQIVPTKVTRMVGRKLTHAGINPGPRRFRTRPTRTAGHGSMEDLRTPPRREDFKNDRDYRTKVDQNKAERRDARTLSEKGYQVRILDESNPAGHPNPDYEIFDGKTWRKWDQASPIGADKALSAEARIRDKLAGGQARRFVVNLDGAGPAAVRDLRQRLVHSSVNDEVLRGLEEVIVIQDGNLRHLFP